MLTVLWENNGIAEREVNQRQSRPLGLSGKDIGPQLRPASDSVWIVFCLTGLANHIDTRHSTSVPHWWRFSKNQILKCAIAQELNSGGCFKLFICSHFSSRILGTVRSATCGTCHGSCWSYRIYRLGAKGNGELFDYRLLDVRTVENLLVDIIIVVQVNSGRRDIEPGFPGVMLRAKIFREIFRSILE